MRHWCRCCWSACGDDGAADEHASFGSQRVTDLHRGFTGLSALVESKLEEKPFSGTSSCFAGGVVASGTVSLTRAQLSMLLEGIDWRRPERTWEPQWSGQPARFFAQLFLRAPG